MAFTFFLTPKPRDILAELAPPRLHLWQLLRATSRTPWPGENPKDTMRIIENAMPGTPQHAETMLNTS